MKSGSIIYDHPNFADMPRGEAEQYVIDAIEHAAGPIDGDNRLSNGPVLDALLWLADLTIVTDEQQQRLKTFLDEDVDDE